MLKLFCFLTLCWRLNGETKRPSEAQRMGAQRKRGEPRPTPTRRFAL